MRRAVRGIVVGLLCGLLVACDQGVPFATVLDLGPRPDFGGSPNMDMGPDAGGPPVMDMGVVSGSPRLDPDTPGPRERILNVASGLELRFNYVFPDEEIPLDIDRLEIGPRVLLDAANQLEIYDRDTDDLLDTSFGVASPPDGLYTLIQLGNWDRGTTPSPPSSFQLIFLRCSLTPGLGNGTVVVVNARDGEQPLDARVAGTGLWNFVTGSSSCLRAPAGSQTIEFDLNRDGTADVTVDLDIVDQQRSAVLLTGDGTEGWEIPEDADVLVPLTPAAMLP